LVSAFQATVLATYQIDLREDQIRAYDLSLALGIGKEELGTLIRATLERHDASLYPEAREGLAQLVWAGLDVHIITSRWNGDVDAMGHALSVRLDSAWDGCCC
jgi:hypothetical protein